MESVKILPANVVAAVVMVIANAKIRMMAIADVARDADRLTALIPALNVRIVCVIFVRSPAVLKSFVRTAESVRIPTAITVPAYAAMSVRAAPPDARAQFVVNVMGVANLDVIEDPAYAAMNARAAPPDAQVKYVPTVADATKTDVLEVPVYAAMSVRAEAPDARAEFVRTVLGVANLDVLEVPAYAVRLQVAMTKYAKTAVNVKDLAAKTDGADAVLKMAVMDRYVIFAMSA